MLVEISACAVEATMRDLHQAEIRLAQIRRYGQIDALHLARQALERGVELA